MAAAENIPSPNYIRNLNFAYMETYSLLRGMEYEQQVIKLQNERKNLKIAYGGRWDDAVFKQQLAALEQQINTRYLIDANGQLHWSARLTHTFKRHDAVAGQFQQILSTEVNEMSLWMCAPVFRDGVIFYDDQGQVLSCLNICLGCDYMMTNQLTYIDADVSAYRQLKGLFLQLGHDVNATAIRI